VFEDRRAAGRLLAERLAALGDDSVVVALPRGGVPVAYEVARRLDAPLDVVVVRKLGAPLQPEYGIGAVGEDGVTLVDARALHAVGVGEDELREIVAREQEELERRRRRYRGDRPPVPVEGRTGILVDDGLATGATAIAGARVLRRRGAGRVVLAVPVASPSARRRLAREVDELIALEAPEDFFAVGQFYERFGATPDEEVRALLDAASRIPEATEGPADPRPKSARP
jgi:putative phosphoribosyl transferase